MGQDRRDGRRLRGHFRAAQFQWPSRQSISAHFCAAVPNFKVMEIDMDDIRWKDEIVTAPPVIEDGHLIAENPGLGRRRQRGVRAAHPPGTRYHQPSL